MKGTYIFLAEGFEITEALSTVDVIRRGGIKISTVSVNENRMVCSSNGIHVMTDLLFSEFKKEALGPTGDGRMACQNEYPSNGDIMIFPGGMPGSTNLASHEELMGILAGHFAAGGSVAAICAAPSVVLGTLDNLKGRKMTCYDGFEAKLIEKGAEYIRTGVVSDGNIITGRGAGWSIDFGLAIVEHIAGPANAAKAKAGMML